jgi:hypothetical protein
VFVSIAKKKSFLGGRHHKLSGAMRLKQVNEATRMTTISIDVDCDMGRPEPEHGLVALRAR